MRESVLTITVLRSWNSPLYAAKSRQYSQGKQYGARLLSDALVLSQCFCRSKRSIGLSRSNFQLNTSRSKSNLVKLVFRLSSPSSNLFRFLTPSVQEKVVQSQRGSWVGGCLFTLLRPVFRISVKWNRLHEEAILCQNKRNLTQICWDLKKTCAESCIPVQFVRSTLSNNEDTMI